MAVENNFKDFNLDNFIGDSSSPIKELLYVDKFVNRLMLLERHSKSLRMKNFNKGFPFIFI